MLIFWALLLRVAAAVQPSVGVCVVLTNIDHKKQESFAELASLLASLDGQQVRRCLVSDLKTQRRRLFHARRGSSNDHARLVG